MKTFAKELKNKNFSETFFGILEKRAKLTEGRPVINLDIMTLEGKEGKLSNYKGWVMYVNFWATDNKDHSSLTEVVCHDLRTKTGWNIIGIPRFLLIDENFNIISADAPCPSKSEPLLENIK